MSKIYTCSKCGSKSISLVCDANPNFGTIYSVCWGENDKWGFCNKCEEEVEVNYGEEKTNNL